MLIPRCSQILPTAPSSEKSPDVGFELRSDGTLILTIELFAFQSKERYEYIYDINDDWLLMVDINDIKIFWT